MEDELQGVYTVAGKFTPFLVDGDDENLDAADTEAVYKFLENRNLELAVDVGYFYTDEYVKDNQVCEITGKTDNCVELCYYIYGEDDYSE